MAPVPSFSLNLFVPEWPGSRCAAFAIMTRTAACYADESKVGGLRGRHPSCKLDDKNLKDNGKFLLSAILLSILVRQSSPAPQQGWCFWCVLHSLGGCQNPVCCTTAWLSFRPGTLLFRRHCQREGFVPLFPRNRPVSTHGKLAQAVPRQNAKMPSSWTWRFRCRGTTAVIAVQLLFLPKLCFAFFGEVGATCPLAGAVVLSVAWTCVVNICLPPSLRDKPLRCFLCFMNYI